MFTVLIFLWQNDLNIWLQPKVTNWKRNDSKQIYQMKYESLIFFLEMGDLTDQIGPLTLLLYKNIRVCKTLKISH